MPGTVPPHRPDVEDRRHDRLRYAAWWTLGLVGLVVAVVAAGGQRALDAQRLATARSLLAEGGDGASMEGFYGGAVPTRAEPAVPPDAARLPGRVRPERAAEPPGPAGGSGVAGSASAAVAPAVSGGSAGGELSVGSNPIGARVWVDNVEVGHTPLAEHPVGPGRHFVRLELDGYHWASRQVVVAEGALADLGVLALERVEVQPLDVELWSAEHPGATVYVDQRFAGTLPVRVALTPGRHSFFVQVGGGEPIQLARDVQPIAGNAPQRLQLDDP